MKAYTVFAKVYDRFMRDIPYKEWCEAITKYLGMNGREHSRVLELGCGTGTFTMLMAQSGYEMTGIDMSVDMLREAERKRKAAKLDITYMQQDMRALEADDRFPVIVSVCDSMNYMENDFDLQSAMERVRDALTDEGIFIFDMKTPAYYERLGKQVFTDSTDDSTYVWENDFDGETGDNEYYITFFIQKKHGLYQKFTEEHTQHAFTDEDVRRAAAAAGLCVREMLGMNMTGEADWSAERVYYVMERSR